MEKIIEVNIDDGKVMIEIGGKLQRGDYWGIIMADIVNNIIDSHKAYLVGDVDGFKSELIDIFLKEIENPTAKFEQVGTG